MIKISMFSRFLAGCCCMWVLLSVFLKMPETGAAGPVTYITQNTDHYRSYRFCTYYRCFPTYSTQYTWTVPNIGKGNTTYFNSRPDAVKPYIIHASYEFHANKPSHTVNETRPALFIYYCDSNGTPVSSTRVVTGWDGCYIRESIDIPANQGVFLGLYTGEYHKYHNTSFKTTYHAYDGYIKVTYQFDITPPNRPVISINDSNIENINGVYYSNLNPTVIQWNNPGDPGSPTSGVIKYRIYNNGNLVTEVAADQNQNLYSLNAEGTYKIQVQALDYENNASTLSEPINVVIDYSVNIPTLPANPIHIQSRESGGVIKHDIHFNWNHVSDQRGVKYQVALSQSSIKPADYEIESEATTDNQYVFADRDYSTDTWYAYVKAINGLGNQSEWARTDGFIIGSPPARFLSVQSHSELRNGEPYYEVAFSVEDVEAASYIIQRRGEGESTRTTLAELTKEQLASNGFTYGDSDLSKPGKYIYYLQTQSGLGAGSQVNTMVALVDDLADRGEKTDPVYICTDETWEGERGIQGDVVIIPGEITLTILPGARIIFDKNCSLMIYGKLKAESVTFQSADGITGSWNGLRIEGKAGLNEVTIEGATRGLSVIGSADVSITGSTFRQNQVGLHVYGTRPQVTNSSFLENTLYGIKEDEGGGPVVNNCAFTGNGMNYYQENETELSIDELNRIEGNGGNHD